jgi:hypothetical protein
MFLFDPIQKKNHFCVHSNNLTTKLIFNVFAIPIIQYKLGGKKPWHSSQKLGGIKIWLIILTRNEIPPIYYTIIFLWLFGGNIVVVVPIKMISNGKNIPTIDEDTNTFTCHLSFMPSTWIGLEPLLSHVCFPTISVKWMSIWSLLTTSKGGI